MSGSGFKNDPFAKLGEILNSHFSREGRVEDYRVPVPDEARAALRLIGQTIGNSLPEGWGFGLFLFTFGDGGTTIWMSNADRPDMIKALQEWIANQSS